MKPALDSPSLISVVGTLGQTDELVQPWVIDAVYVLAGGRINVSIRPQGFRERGGHRGCL